MASRSLDIIIGGRNNLAPVTNSVRRSLEGVATVASGVRNAIMGMLAPVLAGFTLNSIFDQAAEAENAVANLSASLNLLGKGGAGAVADMQDFATSIQRVTTLGDESVLQIATIGANLGRLSGQQLKDATVAAIGLSRRLGIDATEAMKLLSKAAQGNTSTLSRYGIVLDSSLSTQEKFNTLLKLGSDSFSLAAAEAETMGGKWIQLKEIIGDFGETVGGVLGGVLPPVIDWLKAKLIDFSGTFQTVFLTLEFALRNWGDLVELVMTRGVLALVRFYNEVEHMAQVATQYVMWFVTNAVNGFKSLWDFVKNVAMNMAENLFNFFYAVQSWLKGDGFNFEWTALVDGFKASITQLPQILEREKGPIEKGLESLVVGLEKSLGRNFSDFLRERLIKPPKPGEVPLPGGKPEDAATPKRDGPTGSFDPNPNAGLLQSRFVTGQVGGGNPVVQAAQQTAKNTAELKREQAEANRKQDLANRTLADIYRLMLKPPGTSTVNSF